MKNQRPLFVMKSLRDDRSGAVSILFAFMLVFLLVMIGSVLDFGAALVSRSQAQSGTDAAALAIAQPPGGMDPNEAGKRYFETNYHGSVASIDRDYSRLNVTIAPDSVTVISDENLKSNLLQLGGINEVSSDAITIVSKNSNPVPPDLDMVLVLDTSGSMRCPSSQVTEGTPGVTPNYCQSSTYPAGAADARLNEAKLAANDLISRIMGAGSPTIRFALTEYGGSAKVKYGLTSDPAQASSYVNGINAEGWTCGGCGMDAANEILSASPGPVTPRPDGAPLSQLKYVVFMTDGEQNCAVPGDNPSELFGTNCGYKVFDSSGTLIEGALDPSDTRPFDDLTARCNALKAAGVSVATIVFGADVQTPGTKNQTTLFDCASDKPGTSNRQFYYASNYDELRNAFRDIAVTVGRLRITR